VPLCPQPFVNGTCLVRGPEGLRPYSAAGRKDGQVCSGFTSGGAAATKPVTGTTDCQFCYGHDKVSGVQGAPCRGQVGTGETNVEGKLVCER
jgi:hypothetical protein